MAKSSAAMEAEAKAAALADREAKEEALRRNPPAPPVITTGLGPDGKYS